MIISKSYSTLIYLISILLFFNYTSPFIFWVMTELNLILFIFLIISMNDIKYKQEMHDLIMFYFIIQSLASILILSDFFFTSDFYIFNSDLMFISSMLIKLGIFPFFFWMYKVSQFFSSKILSILLTLQKIPFFMILLNSFNSILSLILTFSFLAGSFLIFFSTDLVFLIVSSSVAASYWIFYIYSFSMFFFLFYFFLYSVFIFSFLNSFYNDTHNSLNSIFLIFLFMFLLGLSPLSLFFFKFYIVHFFISSFKTLEFFLFWFFSFFCLFGYMKFSFKSFFYSFGIYKNFYLYTMKNLFFSLSMIVFLFFLYY